MKIELFLIIISLIFLQSCYYKDFRISEPNTFCDNSSGLELKDTLLGLPLMGTSDLSDKSGSGILYHFGFNSDFRALIYFVNLKGKNFKSGNNKEEITGYYNSTMEEISRLQSTGVYKNLSIKNSDTKNIVVKGDTLNAYYSLSTLEHNSIPKISHTLVYGFEGSIVKYRVSYPESDSTTGKEYFNDLLSYFNDDSNKFNFLNLRLIDFDTVTDWESLKGDLATCCDYMLNNQPNRYSVNWNISQHYVWSWASINNSNEFKMPQFFFYVLLDNHVLATAFLASYLKEYIGNENDITPAVKLSILNRFFTYCDKLKYPIYDNKRVSYFKRLYDSGEQKELLNLI